MLYNPCPKLNISCKTRIYYNQRLSENRNTKGYFSNFSFTVRTIKIILKTNQNFISASDKRRVLNFTKFASQARDGRSARNILYGLLRFPSELKLFYESISEINVNF